MVNEAYRTLQNPLTRGLYLLHINPKDDHLESEIDVDSNFLVKMMEMNEEIAEHEDEDGLSKVEERLVEEMGSLVEKVSGDFVRNDAAQAKEHLLKLKYLNSAATRIREIKRECHYGN